MMQMMQTASNTDVVAAFAAGADAQHMINEGHRLARIGDALRGVVAVVDGIAIRQNEFLRLSYLLEAATKDSGTDRCVFLSPTFIGQSSETTDENGHNAWHLDCRGTDRRSYRYSGLGDNISRTYGYAILSKEQVWETAIAWIVAAKEPPPSDWLMGRRRVAEHAGA